MSGTTGRVKAYGTGKGPRQRHRPDQLVHEQYKRQQLTSRGFATEQISRFVPSRAFFSKSLSVAKPQTQGVEPKGWTYLEPRVKAAQR